MYIYFVELPSPFYFEEERLLCRLVFRPRVVLSLTFDPLLASLANLATVVVLGEDLMIPIDFQIKGQGQTYGLHPKLMHL